MFDRFFNKGETKMKKQNQAAVKDETFEEQFIKGLAKCLRSFGHPMPNARVGLSMSTQDIADILDSKEESKDEGSSDKTGESL